MKDLPTACAGFRHTCNVQNAEKFADWIKNRGGVAVWTSADLSDPSYSMSSPAEKDGKPYPKPSWKVGNSPVVITDPKEIGVSDDVEVKRFHVSVQVGGQGLCLKVTDGGSRRIRKEVEKAGDGAYYVFDYGSEDNCVIMKPKGWKSLAEWMEKH
jgi:hypothetical protein